mmetsp:Transcript_3340/g.12069  ORF Transcript_3340/g.12069 Transcript_3340/m.12069 type:complete len:235 (-) Transcript_3340:622-1326(-)
MSSSRFVGDGVSPVCADGLAGASGLCVRSRDGSGGGASATTSSMSRAGDASASAWAASSRRGTLRRCPSGVSMRVSQNMKSSSTQLAPSKMVSGTIGSALGWAVGSASRLTSIAGGFDRVDGLTLSEITSARRFFESSFCAPTLVHDGFCKRVGLCAVAFPLFMPRATAKVAGSDCAGGAARRRSGSPSKSKTSSGRPAPTAVRSITISLRIPRPRPLDLRTRTCAYPYTLRSK